MISISVNVDQESLLVSGKNQEQHEVTADVAAFDQKAFDRKFLLTGFLVIALAACASIAGLTMGADFFGPLGYSGHRS